MISFNNKNLDDALEAFVERVKAILGNKVGMICLFGSVIYNDLSPYYSDLDFHCLLDSELTHGEIDELFEYRVELKKSNNIYSQMLEGEFAPVILRNRDKTSRVAYWGTNRVKVFDSIQIRTFSLMGLIKSGIVIYGSDMRNQYKYPSRQEMLNDVQNMIKTVRTHAITTNEGIHSMDWFFLIAQSMYWMEKDDITSKSNAAKWAYGQNSNGWTSYLPKTLEIRKNPYLAELTENKLWLASLGPAIQEACDDLDKKYAIIINRGIV